MSELQNVTETKIATPSKSVTASQPIPWELLSPQQQNYVDFCVVQGVITNEDGTFTKMKVDEFAHHLGTNRMQLKRWRDGIPNFWEHVAARRNEIFSQTRVQKVYNALFLKATTGGGDVRAMQTFLANFDKSFKMPLQKVEVEAGNSWAALINKRRHIQDQKVIDAEIIDEHSTAN